MGVSVFEDGRVNQTMEVLPRQPLLWYWDGVVTGVKNDFNVNRIQGGCKCLKSKV